MLDKIDIKLDVNQLIDQAGNSIVGAVNNTITDIWQYFTMNIHFATEEKRLRLQNNLKEYAKDIESELNNIPEEYLQEPKTSVLGPALEASKFYIEEPELRKMFAKLIAASANSSLNSRVRSSFTEIIKQLEPLDALVLNSIRQRTRHPAAHIAIGGLRLRNQETLESSHIIHRNLYILDTPPYYGAIVASAIDNLCRLGLVIAGYDNWLLEDEPYAEMEKLPVVLQFREWMTQGRYPLFTEVQVSRGSMRLTEFGIDFTSICLSDDHEQSAS